MPGSTRSKFGGWIRPMEARTASYQVLATECGRTFSNRGAVASVTFTLPATGDVMSGWWCDFQTVAAQAIVIASTPADSLIVHGDATADSVTSAATIGQGFTAISDGTGWILRSCPSAASAATAVTAVTIAT